MAGTIIADSVVDSLGNPFLQIDAESLSTNGYQKLSNGLIIQWGRYTTSTQPWEANINLPIAFPTAGLMVNVSKENHEGYNAWARFNSASQIKIRSRLNTMWFAIGY